jgi:hypothetical protein
MGYPKYTKGSDENHLQANNYIAEIFGNLDLKEIILAIKLYMSRNFKYDNLSQYTRWFCIQLFNAYEWIVTNCDNQKKFCGRSDS